MQAAVTAGDFFLASSKIYFLFLILNCNDGLSMIIETWLLPVHKKCLLESFQLDSILMFSESSTELI